MFLGFGLVFIIVLVIVVVWVLSGSFLSRNTNTRETPLDILKKIYASGEIDKEEYNQMKRKLQD